MYTDAFLIKKEQFFPWLEALHQEFRLIGPVEENGFYTFAEIQSVKDLALNYDNTMLGPRKFIYHPEEKICAFRQTPEGFAIEHLGKASPQILVGVHSCDLHAILVLDKVFLKKGFQDRNYRMWREATVIMGIHCTGICPHCFCASMGTGPLFEPKEVYDFLLTDFGDRYLIELLGERAEKFISSLKLQRAKESDFKKKQEIGRKVENQFKKKIDTTHLVDIILRNQNHPVWKRTAEERCLGCTNCTMVCPTCFCYNQKDEIGFDLIHYERKRYWDSCQELHFAQVHGGNFRFTRMARLRQFVTHKLATWVEQFGCFGCIGCGRCMTWCPTRIDLTEIAKEIMVTEQNKTIRMGEEQQFENG